MTSKNVTEAESVEPSEAASAKSVDDRLIDELVGRAQAEGLQLTGEGGLLQQLTKRLLESALEGEITDHLGYNKHDPAGKNSGNSHNGTHAKTVLTDVGPVEITVPRDREGSFEPKIVKKRQKRLSGVDEMVISLAAKGLTTGEVQAHLAEVYGADVSRQTISTITDKVLEGMAEWQNRPLDAVYPVVFIDAIHVKIRDGAVANRPICVALAVTAEGRRDILGLWAGDGAKHWMHIPTEIKNRGVNDILMLVCDGLKGLRRDGATRRVGRSRDRRATSQIQSAVAGESPADIGCRAHSVRTGRVDIDGHSTVHRKGAGTHGVRGGGAVIVGSAVPGERGIAEPAQLPQDEALGLGLRLRVVEFPDQLSGPAVTSTFGLEWPVGRQGPPMPGRPKYELREARTHR